MRMRRIVLSFVACLAVPHFSTLSHELHDFPEKGFWTQNVCFDFLHNFVWNIYRSKKNCAWYNEKKYIGLHVKYPLFVSDFHETWILWSDFR